MDVTEHVSLQAVLEETYEVHTTVSCTKKFVKNPKAMKMRPIELPDSRGKIKQYFPIPSADFRKLRLMSIVGNNAKTAKMKGTKLFEGHAGMALTT
eukprot:7940332-Pyramimonas_sp.AAC.1